VQRGGRHDQPAGLVQDFLGNREEEVGNDYESETMRRRRERERQEYAEYQSEANQLQRRIDWPWELKLLRDAGEAYRRARPDERSRDGSNVISDYDPIARYERETGRR
jgi:hypothetical protein